ncbi:TQO small subunit DoxD [Halocola ammonii]
MNTYKSNAVQNSEFNTAGVITLAIRLVVGWTYFSALWRRLVLADKLDPESAGYIGEKFNHFLPNALGIQPIIEYLVTHPDVLWWNMLVFTVVEGIVGLFIIFGLFTRLMSVGVFGLAMGILLGSGWIGTTCLDEWQIGILGIATGFVLFLSGGGHFSADNLLMKRKPKLADKKWFSWVGSGRFPLSNLKLKKLALIGSLSIFAMSLYTNQHFHGGLWGALHNKSVSPKIEINDAEVIDGSLNFEVYRVEGVDVYGSFLIGVKLEDSKGQKVFELDGDQLSKLSEQQIENHYVTKVKAGKHSLIIPLGARATISLTDDGLKNAVGKEYKLTLTDISGKEWTADIK